MAKPVIIPPKQAQRVYRRMLSPYLDIIARAQKLILIKEINKILQEEIKTDAFRQDGIIKKIKGAFSKVKNFIDGNKDLRDKAIEATARKIAIQTSETNKQTLDRAFKRIAGIGVLQRETWLDNKVSDFVKENVALIKSIPDQHFERLQKHVVEAASKGVLGKNFSKIIEENYGVTQRRATLIARDQISKFNSSLTEARQQAVGVDKYEWSTSLDERVRDTHAANEGKIFFWNDPPSETGHPGNDINCRCVALPVFD